MNNQLPTKYERSIFMQNKPNLPDAQMNVTAVITMNNELRTMNYFVQNKPNQTQFQTGYLLVNRASRISGGGKNR
jgi:hypothetical protein